LTQAQAVFMAPRGGEEEGVKHHVSTAVIGTRGGVGASTLVTSLAWVFSTEKRMPTALLDLDVHFGTGALTLDLEPGRGLTDAIDNPSRIDGLFIERAMIRANDNLAILSAEAPVNQPLMTDGAAFMQLQEEFKHQFEMTVLDMPRNMMINFPQLLTDVNVIVLAAEMSLASARDTIRILSWLKTNAPHSQVVVVANKVQPGAGEISRTDFEASIERKIDVIIPFDQKAATNAAKLGKTFVDANGSAKASAAIKQLAARVIGASEEDEGDAAAGKKSLLGSLDLKGLLAKKKSAPVAEPAE
ncbi:pilus assembly protein CpaE, partial [Erythrobacter sp. HI0037]